MALELRLQAKQDISDLVAKLNLSSKVGEAASNIYANSKAISSGTHKAGLPAACVYAAARLAEIPLTLYLVTKRTFTESMHADERFDLLEAIEASYKSLRKIHRFKAKHLPPQEYVQRFCDEVEMDLECELRGVRERAMGILNAAAEKNELLFNTQGISSNYAIAAIYTACAQNEVPITMRMLSDIFAITPEAIRHKHRELEKLVGLPADLGRNHGATVKRARGQVVRAEKYRQLAKKVAVVAATEQEVDELFERMQRGEKVF